MDGRASHISQMNDAKQTLIDARARGGGRRALRVAPRAGPREEPKPITGEGRIDCGHCWTRPGDRSRVTRSAPARQHR